MAQLPHHARYCTPISVERHRGSEEQHTGELLRRKETAGLNEQTVPIGGWLTKAGAITLKCPTQRHDECNEDFSPAVRHQMYDSDNRIDRWFSLWRQSGNDSLISCASRLGRTRGKFQKPDLQR